jgi:hypothetical protein
MMTYERIRLPIAVCALVVLMASGCAGVPRPDAALAKSDSAVEQAIEAGARMHAPLLLREGGTQEGPAVGRAGPGRRRAGSGHRARQQGADFRR